MSEFKAGDEFSITYPFYIGEYTGCDEEGPYTEKSYIPGVRYELLAPDGGCSRSVCDGMGKMILNVVSTHKPGRFPERVFFTRKWMTPKGKLFGKNRLHQCVVWRFRELTKGYPFRIDDVVNHDD